MKRVCVFCGSSKGARPEYVEAATDLGREIARHGKGLVYGGGNVGLMGVVADAAIAAGGEVIGVIPRALVDKEVAHLDLPELRIVESMHERKAEMAELAEGFVALPGGIGTLEEFFEVLTWGQLGFHEKPCGLLNIAGYYDPLIRLVEHAVAENFLKPKHRDMLLVSTEVAGLLDAFERYHPPGVEKWIGREEI